MRLMPLSAVIAAIAVAGCSSAASSSSSAAPAAAVTTHATTHASAHASPAASCRTQVRAWATGGGSDRISALSADLTRFDAAVTQFAADQNGTGVTAADVSGIKSAAAQVQAGARNVGRHPAPRCASALRSAIKAVAADYWQAGSDAGKGMAQYSAGNLDAATSDINTASGWIAKGSKASDKATGDLKKYE